MPHYKVSTIAILLGVSDDTVRRWLDDGLVTRVDSGENSGRFVSMAHRSRL